MDGEDLAQAVDALVAPLESAQADIATVSSAFSALPSRFGGSLAFMFNLVEGRPALVGDAAAMALQRGYFEGKWGSGDVLTASVRSLPSDMVHYSHTFLSEQHIHSSPFFTDYLAAHDIMWGAGWLFDLDGERWCFALCRSARQGQFGASDRDLLAAAAPRMSRAMQRINHAGAQHARGVRDALDVRRRAYALIDHRGLVTHISPAGAGSLDDGLQLIDGRLCAQDGEINERLRGVALAARFGAVGAEHAGLAPLTEFAIRRGGGRSPIVVTPLRTRAAPLDALPGVQIVLRLADLEHQPQVRPEPLRDLFNLTPREIEVAQQIARGDDARIIAEALALKETYVRQLIKSILAKTGLNRIGKLVAVLARLPDDG